MLRKVGQRLRNSPIRAARCHRAKDDVGTSYLCLSPVGTNDRSLCCEKLGKDSEIRRSEPQGAIVRRTMSALAISASVRWVPTTAAYAAKSWAKTPKFADQSRKVPSCEGRCRH